MNAARAALLHGATDRQMAEDFSIVPVIAPYGASSPGAQTLDVNARPIADPDRAAVTFSGVWTEPSVHAPIRPMLASRDGSGGAERRISDGRPCVKYADDALPWRPAVGYQITRVATGGLYSVSEIHGDGFGRTVLILAARTAP